MRSVFDATADDLRAALGWAAEQPEHRLTAYELALTSAELTFARNLVGESQRRYEQAAELADDAAAGCRMRGADMYRLFRAAADVARAAGHQGAAATDLATAAITVYRMADTFTGPPPTSAAASLLSEARALAGGDPVAAAAIALAECGVLADTGDPARTEPGPGVAATIGLAERAVELAFGIGDRLVRSAALDALAAAQLWADDTSASVETTRRRVELLLPVTPASALEQVTRSRKQPSPVSGWVI